ncbi:TonB-dependent receptor domain-containing protein [Luteimonas sp. SDU101]|uniref:TonB-dependent receptor domain-containing protein n=1 Tax=Luteimonas sp. SDU101 TaxID=3422593 RepID=UPI003EBFD88D
MHDRFRGILAASALSLAITSGLGAAPAHAQAGESRATYRFDLPAQPLAESLRAIARQSGANVLFESKDVDGIAAPALRTSATASEAIAHVLAGTELSAHRAAPGTMVIRRSGATREAKPQRTPPGGAAQGGVAAEGPLADDHVLPGGSAQADPAADATTLGAMVVTGTRIRGGTTPSPVIAIGSERIREEGFSDLGEVTRSLPQNYSGGQNPGVVPFTISGAGGQNTNITGGSSLNLRGLGQDASLTLLNGRRMAYGGVSQGVDISAIPVEAVERVDIVPDGASAIYGSDAVGGVANVVLRRSFDGVAMGARYGEATSGGLATREYAATAGTTWRGGGLIATFKDVATDAIYARQRAYTAHLRDPWTLYPESDQRSALVSVHQQLGDTVELGLDAFRTARTQDYGVYNDVGNQFVRATPETTTWLASPSVAWFLPNDWTMSASAAWARTQHDQVQTTERLTTGAQSITDLCVCSGSRVVELGAEGPLFAMPAGDARMAIGAGRRHNDFREYNRRVDVATIDGKESSRFAYAELNLPLLRPGQGGAGRLEVSAAVRGEDYASFGGVRTPKVGLIYGPSADFTLKGSWGRSFKAPTLYQLLRSEQVVLRSAASSGGAWLPDSSTVLYLDGGNPDLQPEHARTWTASIALHPAALPGFDAELAWFDIDYTGRVVQPITDPTQALSNPAYAEFVHWAPSPEMQAALIARDGDGVITNQAGRPYVPADVAAVVFFQFRNAVAQRIRGLDLIGAYRWDLATGRLTLRGAASWLDSVQRFSTTDFDLAGTLHNPPAFSGRVGTVWAADTVTVSTFINHKQGLKNVVAGTRTASYTTVDATLRYAWERERGRAAGWELALSVQNLFNRAPPPHDVATVTPFQVPPYDATNFSPIGRFASVAVTRHW